MLLYCDHWCPIFRTPSTTCASPSPSTWAQHCLGRDSSRWEFIILLYFINRFPFAQLILARMAANFTFQTFKAMRRAIYGIHSIVAIGIGTLTPLLATELVFTPS